MVEKEIMLSSIEDVKKFVNIVMSRSYEVDIVCGKYTVNAKSIMGIFSVDLTKPLHMVAHCDCDDGILNQVEPFIYVCDKK